jgi:cobaltochelatase CobN
MRGNHDFLLARFLSDTVLLTGEGFEPPSCIPENGVHTAHEPEPGRPTVSMCSTGHTR